MVAEIASGRTSGFDKRTASGYNHISLFARRKNRHEAKNPADPVDPDDHYPVCPGTGRRQGRPQG
jgi:hypothetical protein